MKKTSLILIILTLSFSALLLKDNIKTFINNITVSYTKYVLLGGEDITVYINDSMTSYDNTVSNVTAKATTGILTYIDTTNNTYGAIAHNITDKEGYVNGEIYLSEIIGINKSTTSIGNKIASINTSNLYGSVNETKNTGIYGEYLNSTSDKKLIQVGMPSEVKLGTAYIVTSIGNEVKEYEIKITSIDMFNSSKNMTIEITDEELINTTGGIIKGMSGSPIVQNGKLIGALSHSYSDEFTKGSAIFITNMIK